MKHYLLAPKVIYSSVIVEADTHAMVVLCGDVLYTSADYVNPLTGSTSVYF